MPELRKDDGASIGNRNIESTGGAYEDRHRRHKTGFDRSAENGICNGSKRNRRTDDADCSVSFKHESVGAYMEQRQFKKQFIKKNSGQKLIPKGIVLHETATPGATAQNELSFFSTHSATSAHAFIDWIEDLQIIPWDIKAWHAKEPANSLFIGVEMCRPKTHDPEKFKIVYWATVDAFARIYRYVLNIKTVTVDNCMAHFEVSNKWHNTDHTDPSAYFAEYGKTMAGFRADVQYRLTQKWGA